MLLFASFGFYLFACRKYIEFILITIVSTYFGGRWLYAFSQKAKADFKERKDSLSKEGKKALKNRITAKKKAILAVVLIFNFGILAFLKYYNFFAGSLSSLFSFFGVGFEAPKFDLILPLGISFYTFQSMGYIIDIYRGKFPAERDITKFALFVSFFPQIIQGPISMYGELAPQLYEWHDFKFENIKSGAELILYGFFKKIVLADRLAVAINRVTDKPAAYSGTVLLITVLFYAVQLYADFSGGIDIARGVSEMMGIKLPENFRQPYFSRSLSEYWRRWHITLGAWLKNYLFYPIAMSKAFQSLGKKIKALFGKNLAKVLPVSIASLITFTIIGIWHGAKWKYVAFGLWNGSVIMLSTLFEKPIRALLDRLKINRESRLFILLQMLRTFILVLIGYYFDIAKGFKTALRMIYRSIADFHITDLTGIFPLDLKSKELLLGLDGNAYLIIILCTLVIFAASIIRERTGKDVRSLINKMPYFLQCIILLAGICFVALFGVYGPGVSATEFVYMQF